MKRIKMILHRLLRPGVMWLILLTIISGGLLAFIFLNGIESSLFTIAAYVLSAYTLTVLVLFVVSRDVGRAKALIYMNKYGNKYMTDITFRARTSLYISLFINLIYAIFQLVTGIFYTSYWYGAVAVYYIVLCGLRFLLLRHFRMERQDRRQELKAYRFCGYLLFSLNVTMTGMVIQMVRDGEGARYPGLMIYAMASYAFYRIIISIINFIKHRKLNIPVLSASKTLNFAVAVMAMFSLQTAMFAEFGGETGNLAHIMNSISGGCVCLIIFGMAVLMVIRANQNLKELECNDYEAD